MEDVAGALVGVAELVMYAIGGLGLVALLTAVLVLVLMTVCE